MSAARNQPPREDAPREQFKPTNLATCYDGSRVYVKDMPTGRCFTNSTCKIEIDEQGVILRK